MIIEDMVVEPSTTVAGPTPIVRKPVQVIGVTNPFTTKRITVTVSEGASLLDIVSLMRLPDGIGARVFIEREDKVYGPIPRAQWARIKPRQGARVIVRATAAGGGDGGDSNKTLRLILQVVIILIAIVIIVVSYGTLTPVGLALIMVAVGLSFAAINMLLPPQVPKLGKLSNVPGGAQEPESPTLSITGSNNRANPYGPIPKIFGRHRLFPTVAAVPFTEIVGNDQYLRQLFCVGYGPLELSDLRIGPTPLANFQGVQVEVRQGFPDDLPLTLYTRDVAEQPLTIALTAAAGWQIRTGDQPASEISIDIVFPNGLVQITPAGLQISQAVQLAVEYRKVGTVTWIDPRAGVPWIISDQRVSQVRVGLRWTTAEEANYEVRVIRGSADNTDILIHDQAVWSSLRTIRYAPPILPVGPPLCVVALRIKATDQLNGVVDTFNCIAQAILPDWDATTETWIERATSSPAAAYRAVLQGTGNARPIADSRIDLPSLQDWAERAAAGGFTYNQVVDFRHTVLEQLRDIAGGARAAFTMIDGKFGVVQDLPQTVPVQHFTPRNSFNFHGHRAFIDIPHAWKVRFINPEADWQQDERIVYDDGYDATTATKYEVLETIGITDRDQAWRIGRYHLAAIRLRPETFELSTDIEGLICTRGDLVRVTHDVMLVGLASARIKEVFLDGADCTGIRVDEECPMAADGTYNVRIRYEDGSSVLKPIVTVEGFQKTLLFETPFAAPHPMVDDLVMFGEAGLESLECLVKEIAHEQDLVMRLTLLPHSPAVYDADQGPIPPYHTGISFPPQIARIPPTPVVDKIASDESVLVRALDGSLQARILITLHFIATSAIPADWLEVQYRPAGSSTPYIALPNQPPLSTEVSITAVEERQRYDVQLRSVTRTGLTSGWAGFTNYLVIGKTAPPPAPTNVRLIEGVLSWDYVPPPDFAGFKLRRIPGSVAIWDQGLKLHDGVHTASAFATLPPMSGEWTIMVKGFDTSGIGSVGVGALTITVGAALIRNAVLTQDEAALGFLGTITNGTVSGISGALEADQETTGFWTNNEAIFWAVSGFDLFWLGPYKELMYDFAIATGATGGQTRLLIEIGAQGNYRIEYKLAAAIEWLPFPGVVEGILASTTYHVRIIVDGGSTQGIISQLVAYLDAPDISETFENIALAVTTGSRLPITLPYRLIKTIQATIVASGGETAITALAADKDASLGPLIKSYDAAGAVVAGHIDAVVVGF